MVGSDGRIGDDHFSDDSPNYDLISSETVTSMGVASALIVATIALMWVLRGTVFAEATIWLYRDAPFAPFAGVVVFGLVLTVGRMGGLAASAKEQYGLAVAASALLAVGYGAFGAGILSLYASGIHASALGLTAAITAAITIGAATLVYTTDHSFENWATYSGVCMLAGIGLVFLYTIIPIAVLGLLAFGVILIGWIIDLVYEIYMVSASERSPIANGIGVYVAFMGVFVHILQLVLEYLAHAES